MQIVYTDHATERLRDRGISKKFVRDALKHGQKREQQPDGSIKLTHAQNNRNLIVIYQVSGKDKYLIITSYYDN